MTTRLPASSARTRATSRSIVVLPTPGFPSRRMLSPRADDVLDYADGAVDRAPDTNGQADDVSGTVPHGRDSVQGSLDTCPVVGPERTDVSCDEFDIGVVDLPVAEYHGVIGETSLGRSSEIEDNF